MSITFFVFFCLFAQSLFSKNLFQPLFINDIEVTSEVISVGSPSTSLIENGFFVSVWSIHTNSPNFTGIYGQIYDSNGKKYGAKIAISSASSFYQDHPSVAMLESGVFMVVWESLEQNGAGYDIYGQLYEFSKKIGEEFKVNSKTFGDQKNPTISSSGGYFTVAWDDPSGIFAKVFDCTGGFSPEVLISETTNFTHYAPSLDMLTMYENNEKYLYVVLVWNGELNSEYTIFGRSAKYFIWNTSFVLGVEKFFNPNSEKFPSKPPYKPQVSLAEAKNSNLMFVIVWTNVILEEYKTLSSIKGQMFVDFKKIGEEFTANTYTKWSKAITTPSVSFKKDYGFIIVWQTVDQDGDGLGLFGQYFSEEAVKIGEEFQINKQTKNDQRSQTVKMNSLGKIVASWISDDENTLASTLLFQLYTMEKDIFRYRKITGQSVISALDIPSNSSWMNCQRNEKTNNYLLSYLNKEEIIKMKKINPSMNTEITMNINALNVVDGDASLTDSGLIIIAWNIESKDIFVQVYDEVTRAPVSEKIKVNSEDSLGTQPRISSFDDGTFVIIWICEIETTRVCGKYFISSNQSSDQFEISSSTKVLRSNCYISRDSNNQIIITWVTKDEHNQYNIIGKWGMIIDSKFVLQTSEFVIYNTLNPNFNSYPKVSNEVNMGVVVWDEPMLDGTGYNIYAKIFDLDGITIGQTFQVNTYQALDQRNPSIVVLENIFFVVWVNTHFEKGSILSGQFFDKVGNKIGNEIKVSDFGKNISSPLVAADSNGNIEVSFLDHTFSREKATLYKVSYHPFKIPTSKYFLGFQKFDELDDSETEYSAISKDGKYLYSALNYTNYQGVLQIYDLEYLVLIKEVLLEINILSMVKQGDFLYFLGKIPSLINESLLVMDVSHHTDPHILKLVNIEHSCLRKKSNELVFMKATNNRIYLGSSINFCIYEIKNPVEPQFLEFFNVFGEEMYFPSISDNYFEYTNALYYRSVWNMKNLKEIPTIGNCLYEKGSHFSFIYRNEEGIFVIAATRSKLLIHQINDDFKCVFYSELKIYSFISLDIEFNSYSSSKNHQYLALSGVKNSKSLIVFFDVRDLKKVSFLGFYEEEAIIQEITYIKEDNYLLLNLNSGLNIIKPIIRNKTLETLDLTISQQYDLVQRYSNNFWVGISPSQKTIYLMGNNDSVLALNVSSFNNYSPNLQSELPQAISDKTFYLYTFNNKKTINQQNLVIYEVANERTFTAKGNLNFTGLIDYIITKDEKFMFVGNWDGVSEVRLLTINISNSSNPIIISNLLIIGTTMPSLALSNNEKDLYLSLGLDGIYIINIEDKTYPYFIRQKIGANVNFGLVCSFYDMGNNYLIASRKGNNQLLIYKIDRNYNLAQIAEIKVDSEIKGIKIYKKNYVFVMFLTKVALYSLHNDFFPNLIKSLDYSMSSTDSFTKLVVSDFTNSIYSSTGKAINLLYPIPNGLYGDISLNFNSDAFELILSLWPLDLKQGHSLKLLNIKNWDQTTKWVFVDYDQMKIIMHPTEIEDLTDFLQPIEISYTSDIQDQELNQEEIDFLYDGDFIDTEYFLTRNFNPKTGIRGYMGNLSEERLNFVLQQHYHTKNFYFSLDLLMGFAAPPILRFPVQYQLFNLKDNENEDFSKAEILVDQNIDFILDLNTFESFGKLPIKYSAENLPNWLFFDNILRRFHGKASIEEFEKNFYVAILASNGFHEKKDFLYFSINYHKPILVNPLQEQIIHEPEFGYEAQYFLKKNTFVDPNNDILHYECTLDGKTLPKWIKFDEHNFMIYFNPGSEQLFQTYYIQIEAKNKHFSVKDSFKISIHNSWKLYFTVFLVIFVGLLAIFLIKKFKILFCNCVLQHRYSYPTKTIIAGKFFEQDIFFIKDDLKKASLIFDYMLKNKNSNLFNESNILKPESKDLLALEIKKAYQELFGKLKINNINQKVLDPEGTLFVIIQCFLTRKLLHSYPYTEKIYKEMKKAMETKFSRSWHFELLSFESQLLRDYKYRKFPTLIYNEEKIRSLIERSQKIVDPLSQSLDPSQKTVSMVFVLGLLKADALGIPNYRKKWCSNCEYSKGESCFFDIVEIKEIKAERLEGELHGKFNLLEFQNNKKLPIWLDYKVRNGVLTLFGTPQAYDEGLIRISLIHNSSFIIRSHIFRISAGGLLADDEGLGLERRFESLPLITENQEVFSNTKIKSEIEMEILKNQP